MSSSRYPIQAERLVKSFGPTAAVRGISFRVQKNTVTALLGENGAGKTTILKLMMGFLRPDSGNVSLAPSIVGYVPERPAFFPWLKGREIIKAAAEKYRIPPLAAGPRFEELSRRLGFDGGLLGRKAGTYSAGNQKKFSYLQSLLISPDILVIDEPFAALDPESIGAVREFLHAMRSSGKTVFLSSHHLSELERI